MQTLSFTERMFVKSMFRDRMAELYGDGFEDFFDRLMVARYPDCVEVRTHGNIGDLSADGLRLHSGRLYACYAPEVFDAQNAARVGAKFSRVLSRALTKRSGEFQTFVFVYNDPRGGVHPEVTRLLAQARRDHAPLTFAAMGPKRLLNDLFKLVWYQIEDILGSPIQVEEVAYGIGLD